MKWYKWFFSSVLGVATLFAILAVFLTCSVSLYRYAGGLTEEARHSIHKNSTSYVDGTIRRLWDLRREYSKAQNDGHRDILRSTILHEVADFPEDKLPEELRNFVSTLRR